MTIIQYIFVSFSFPVLNRPDFFTSSIEFVNPTENRSVQLKLTVFTM